MSSLFDGFIFDVDGTITSTNQLIFDSFNFIAEKYLNKTFTDKEIIAMFGPTENVILKQLCSEKFEEVKVEYYRYYSQNHWKAKLYPGIKEILDYLKNKKFPLGIFTGKGREATTITLKTLEVNHYFDLIVTGDDVTNHKPSAEGILKFVKHFGLKKERVLMIGDSISDIKASKEAGVKMASVLWDSYGSEEVKSLQCDYCFHSVNQLNNFLMKNIKIFI